MHELVSSNRAEIVLRDGSGPPVELVIPCDTADFAISGLPPSDGYHDVEIVQSRGKICGIIDADRTIPAVSLSAYLSSLTQATPGNVADFIRRTGAYATNKSTLGEDKKYTIDITFRWLDEVDDVHAWDLEDVLPTLEGFNDGRPATISVSGQVLGDHKRSTTPAA